MAIQRARHQPAMTYDVRNATDNFIGFSVLPTRDPIPLASMKDAKHVDSGITVQHFSAAGGFVILANEIAVTH